MTGGGRRHPATTRGAHDAPTGGLPILRHMTTARLVPVTTEMDGEELDAEDAWRLVRRWRSASLATDRR